MIINDFILQDKKFSASMKAYAEEIDRLESFRTLVLSGKLLESTNYDLVFWLGRVIKLEQISFHRLETAYNQKEHIDRNQDKITEIIIPEITAKCKELEDIFKRIVIAPPMFKTIPNYD
jgi:uncharacterized protein (DUF2225 family)